MRQKVLLQMWEDWNSCRCPYFPNNFAQNPLEAETPPEIANEGVRPLLRPLPNTEQQRVERIMQVREEARRREQTEIENAEHLRKQSLAREREEARKNSQARRELEGRRQGRRQGRGGAGGGNLRR